MKPEVFGYKTERKTFAVGITYHYF